MALFDAREYEAYWRFYIACLLASDSGGPGEREGWAALHRLWRECDAPDAQNVPLPMVEVSARAYHQDIFQRYVAPLVESLCQQGFPEAFADLGLKGPLATTNPSEWSDRDKRGWKALQLILIYASAVPGSRPAEYPRSEYESITHRRCLERWVSEFIWKQGGKAYVSERAAMWLGYEALLAAVFHAYRTSDAGPDLLAKVAESVTLSEEYAREARVLARRRFVDSLRHSLAAQRTDRHDKELGQLADAARVLGLALEHLRERPMTWLACCCKVLYLSHPKEAGEPVSGVPGELSQLIGVLEDEFLGAADSTVEPMLSAGISTLRGYRDRFHTAQPCLAAYKGRGSGARKYYQYHKSWYEEVTRSLHDHLPEWLGRSSVTSSSMAEKMVHSILCMPLRGRDRHRRDRVKGEANQENPRLTRDRVAALFRKARKMGLAVLEPVQDHEENLWSGSHRAGASGPQP